MIYFSFPFLMKRPFPENLSAFYSAGWSSCLCFLHFLKLFTCLHQFIIRPGTCDLSAVHDSNLIKVSDQIELMCNHNDSMILSDRFYRLCYQNVISRDNAKPIPCG